MIADSSLALSAPTMALPASRLARNDKALVRCFSDTGFIKRESVMKSILLNAFLLVAGLVTVLLFSLNVEAAEQKALICKFTDSDESTMIYLRGGGADTEWDFNDHFKIYEEYSEAYITWTKIDESVDFKIVTTINRYDGAFTHTIKGEFFGAGVCRPAKEKLF